MVVVARGATIGFRDCLGEYLEVVSSEEFYLKRMTSEQSLGPELIVWPMATGHEVGKC